MGDPARRWVLQHKRTGQPVRHRERDDSAQAVPGHDVERLGDPLHHALHEQIQADR